MKKTHFFYIILYRVIQLEAKYIYINHLKKNPKLKTKIVSIDKSLKVRLNLDFN